MSPGAAVRMDVALQRYDAHMSSREHDDGAFGKITDELDEATMAHRLATRAYLEEEEGFSQ